ncbi:DUF3179 domain-containing (seleno)protein [Daejeonella sp.]|uniref:DUF3179 domain-containing (seleno)protein n=1 Tax=Daejeonella sp. TaxID=2805397 RepID=UPI002731959C|nr:DUF3179 domain-containing (seleno)protein [Daejeonella sp.]MDP2415031.1 DUF3179 domain-containing (seleno)protein [Daejeonella sp.]
MKKLFYFGILFLIVFEIANVYFIMPMPGSQKMESLDAAYFLYSWRWLFRILFMLMILAGIKHAFSVSKWLVSGAILMVSGIAIACNFIMAADSMFKQPGSVIFKKTTENKVETGRLILGINQNGESKAYPIQFLGYHHQVRDSIGGKAIMVTYCTVCRTGRVFEPLIEGKPEEFRLVGMDHFNAMFEDKSTGSWWRQVSGKAVAGPLKGKNLPEIPSIQTTLEKWIELYPNTLIMQADEKFKEKYEGMSKYESGTSTSKLTLRDKASWKDKSWVIGLESGSESKAYDWNRLQKEGIIHDELGGKPVAIILSRDKKSFVALERLNSGQLFSMSNDTLITANNRYNFIGISLDSTKSNLKRLNAYQEYWHSWQIFHPLTKK